MCDVENHDVILGMDWLSKNHLTIHYFEKEIVFHKPEEIEFWLSVTKSRPLSCVVFALQAQCILQSGSSIGFLMLTINKVRDKELTVNEVRVVWEFPKVFPDDLPGMPPNREVEFTIDLALDATPIFEVPYRMAPKEL